MDSTRTLTQSWRLPTLAVLAAEASLAVGLAAKGYILARPGGPRYLVMALVALCSYAAAVVFVTTLTQTWAPIALRVGVATGIVTGSMWVLSLAIETFAGFSGGMNLAATAPLLLGGFALWGAGAAIACRRTHSRAAGILASIWAAMICVIVTIAFGFILGFIALPLLGRNMGDAPEYLASHWDNPEAFAIANTLDAASTHLLLGPIIAVFTGATGVVIADNRRQNLS